MNGDQCTILRIFSPWCLLKSIQQKKKGEIKEAAYRIKCFKRKPIHGYEAIQFIKRLFHPYCFIKRCKPYNRRSKCRQIWIYITSRCQYSLNKTTSNIWKWRNIFRLIKRHQVSKSGNNDKYTITYNIYILNILTNGLQVFDLDLKKRRKFWWTLRSCSKYFTFNGISVQIISLNLWSINVKADSLRNHQELYSLFARKNEDWKLRINVNVWACKVAIY